MSLPSVGFFLGRPDRSALLAAKLRERGFRVTHYNVEAANGDPIVRLSPGFTPALAHVLFRTDHDVYFTGLSHVPSTCLYLNHLVRRRPYVFNATGLKWEMFRDQSKSRPFPALFEHGIHPLLLDRTYAGASRIVCNSDFLRLKIGERYPRYRDRLLTIYNGIDFERYSSGRRRAIPGTEPGDFVVLCVTSINFGGKSIGVGLILEALARARRIDPRFKLVIAAKASNPEYRAALGRWIEEAGLGDSVITYFNYTEIPDLLASSDLFVYATPSESNDSLPRAILEAQAAGLPVVTTATSGCPEIVAHGETGLVVPYDTGAVAEALLVLAGDRERRRRMRESARERTRVVFSWERMADEYGRLFEEIAN